MTDAKLELWTQGVDKMRRIGTTGCGPTCTVGVPMTMVAASTREMANLGR